MLRSAFQALRLKLKDSRMFTTTNNFVVKLAEKSDNMKMASLFATTFVRDARLESDITIDEEYLAILEKRDYPELYSFFVAKKDMEPTAVGALELSMKANVAQEIFFRRSRNPEWIVSNFCNNDAIIDKIVVARTARRQGVGFALIERAVQHAHGNQAERIFAEVGAFNVPVRGALEKAGFQSITYDKSMYNMEYVYGKKLMKAAEDAKEVEVKGSTP